MTDVAALTSALSAVDGLLARAVEDMPIEMLVANLRSAVSETEHSSIPMTANLLEEGNVTSPEALAAAKFELTALIARESVKPEKPAPKRPARQVSRRGRP